MGTLVAAGQQLLDEIEEVRDKVKATLGDEDGLGFIRSIDFDAATAKWLEPRLEAVDDERIEAFVDKTVTFVSDVRADFRNRFGLDEADEVLTEQT